MKYHKYPVRNIFISPVFGPARALTEGLTGLHHPRVRPMVKRSGEVGVLHRTTNKT